MVAYVEAWLGTRRHVDSKTWAVAQKWGRRCVTQGTRAGRGQHAGRRDWHVAAGKTALDGSGGVVCSCGCTRGRLCNKERTTSQIKKVCCHPTADKPTRDKR